MTRPISRLLEQLSSLVEAPDLNAIAKRAKGDPDNQGAREDAVKAFVAAGKLGDPALGKALEHYEHDLTDAFQQLDISNTTLGFEQRFGFKQDMTHVGPNNRDEYKAKAGITKAIQERIAKEKSWVLIRELLGGEVIQGYDANQNALFRTPDGYMLRVFALVPAPGDGGVYAWTYKRRLGFAPWH